MKKNTQKSSEENAAPAVRNITQREQEIMDRVQKSVPDWDTITEESMVDFSLSKSIFDLPPEAKKKQDNKEFAFRWIESTDDNVDLHTQASPPLTWWACNRVTTPYLKKYFKHHGGIQVADMILVVKPWHLHEMVQDKKRSMADFGDDKMLKKRAGVQKENDAGDPLVEYITEGPKTQMGGNDIVTDVENVESVEEVGSEMEV